MSDGLVYIIETDGVKAMGETSGWKSFVLDTWQVSVTEIVI